MSFRRIEYFLSVAKHLNFTKAARECYVAQAAISQQIKQFEEELGFKPVSYTHLDVYKRQPLGKR